MDPSEFRSCTRFILKLGRALHECGTSSQRTERHLSNVTHLLGLNGTFMISPTTFTCAFWEHDELDQFVHIERTEPAELNLGRLWEIDRLVEGIVDGRLTLSEGDAQLNVVMHAPWNHSNAFNAMFIGALTVGIFSNLYSRITRGPGSILMTQGIILLVPGSKTYMILNQWVSGETILPGAQSGNQALMVFVALIAGLLFSNALLPTQKTL